MDRSFSWTDIASHASGVPDIPDGGNDIPTIVDPNGVPSSASAEAAADGVALSPLQLSTQGSLVSSPIDAVTVTTSLGAPDAPMPMAGLGSTESSLSPIVASLASGGVQPDPPSPPDETSVGFQSPSGHILWNLQGSGDLISGSGVIGSLLAPSATIQSGGVINGQVIVTGTTSTSIDGGASDSYNHLMDGTGITLPVISNKIVRQVCIDFEDIPSGVQYRAEEDCCLAVPPEVRIRPEITSMTPEDRRDFFIAFRAVYEKPDNLMKDLINRHQAFFSRGLHNNGAFLPWHRGYILELENLIREDHPNMTIPYWDWGQQPQINQTSFFGDAEDQISGDGDDGTRCVNGGIFGFG